LFFEFPMGEYLYLPFDRFMTPFFCFELTLVSEIL